MSRSPSAPAPEGQGEFRFGGDTYDPFYDEDRLTTQLGRVYRAMRSGDWFTLGELADLARGSEASVSARLRDLRKPECGGHTVERRARGDRGRGLFEYRMVPK